MRVLLVDDELIYYKLISPELKKAGYELKHVRTGKKGLAAIRSYDPEMLILDLRLPDIDGFEIMQRLRSDADFNNIPVILITTEKTLDIKLKAFDLGVDDYLVKPFPPEELVARLGILARRSKIMKIAQGMDGGGSTVSTSVAVHSLRGGVGLSSLATNLSLSFQEIWNKRTLVVDGVLAAGQIAMMLNENPHASWGSLIGVAEDEINNDVLDELISHRKDSVDYIAASRNPIAADSFTAGFWKEILLRIKERSEILVFDTAHNFSDVTISILTEVENILLVVTPDMASLRAAVSTLDVYDQLGFAPDKIKLVFNPNTNITGILITQLEKVFERTFDYILPHEPTEVFRAINFGKPFILENPKLPISIAIEDMAYDLSDSSYKSIPPASPSSAWKDVTKRIKQKSKK